MSQQRSQLEVRQYVRTITERFGWKLNEDEEMLVSLVDGLRDNWNRLGYYNCPCRDNQGDPRLDRDVICPCVYAREHDVEVYGYCYCALFFRNDFDMTQPVKQIPERRPPDRGPETPRS